MSAQILDGKILAQRIKDELKKEAGELKKKTGKVPCLVNVMVGKDASALNYALSQQRCAQHIGLEYRQEALPEKASQEELEDTIEKLNGDFKVNGILLYKPVPKHIDYAKASELIHPDKSLEGVNITNFGRMLLSQTRLVPCTAAAVMEHIKTTGVYLRGKEAVVVGRSEIVGKPLSVLLLAQHATVTICHSGTHEAKRLIEHIHRADILVAAVGKPQMVQGEWIKEDAIVIDVGINQVDNKIVGDVDFESAKERASFITPVPGGVGPVTVVMLMRNAIEAFKLQSQL